VRNRQYFTGSNLVTELHRKAARSGGHDEAGNTSPIIQRRKTDSAGFTDWLSTVRSMLSVSHQEIVASVGSGCLIGFLGRFFLFTGRPGLRVLGGLAAAAISCFSLIQFTSFGDEIVMDFNILTHRAAAYRGVRQGINCSRS
jgi:hypothetical protein